MKRIWDVLMMTLAANFLVLAGVTAWLYQSHHLDKERVEQIKQVMFPTTQPEAPATQPAETNPATQPTLQLEKLLAKESNLSVGEQAEFIRKTFDVQMATLQRRQSELGALQSQIDLANQKLASDRAAFEEEQRKLKDREQQAQKLAGDQGFQESLNVYTAMPPRQAKAVFLTLSDDTMVQYLQAMQPRTAAKIIKEFKSPDEIDRIQRIMEKMRNAAPATQPAKE